MGVELIREKCYPTQIKTGSRRLHVCNRIQIAPNVYISCGLTETQSTQSYSITNTCSFKSSSTESHKCVDLLRCLSCLGYCIFRCCSWTHMFRRLSLCLISLNREREIEEPPGKRKGEVSQIFFFSKLLKY